MQIHVQPFTVHKRFPLTISRGTTAQTTNLWVRVEQDGIAGWGEASPFSTGEQPQTTPQLLDAIAQLAPQLACLSPLDRDRLEAITTTAALPSAARVALDMACYDWLGKRAGLPLWQLWGLDRDRIVPTSVTIGINPPDAVRQRVRDWLAFADIRVLKVKLGSPDGIAADQAILQAVRQTAPNLPISIDANGGWSLPDAISMGNWLADQGVTYVEQPLPRGAESHLPALRQAIPLPIFVDESCFTSADIPALSDRVDGINIKLMKAGSLTEVLRMIHTARAHGLQVMFGCYSDSSLANTALAHLSPLADYLDLDSHLNLLDDPFTGATLENGCLVPSDRPGLGVERVNGG